MSGDRSDPGAGEAAGAGDDPHDREIPSTAGPYRIVRELGRGGMGIVYLAHDPRLDRPVALKFLPPSLHLDDDAATRFRTEARAASALDHPAIGTVYDIGEADDGRTFIAMAYYEGETLRARLERGRLEPEEAREIARRLADGLAAAHAAGIIHRDVKPRNVILTREGDVKILDFGTAKISGEALTRTGVTLGTVFYMSPEQTWGETVDGRSDVWAVGVVLYEMLTGRRPFRGDNDRAVLNAIRHDEPPAVAELAPDAPPGLVAVVERCLRKDPADRFAGAGELLSALSGGGVDSTKRVDRAIMIGAGVLAVIAIVLFGVRPAAELQTPPPADTMVGVEAEPEIPRERRIAVLPFEHLGSDPDSSFLAEGLTEEVARRLSRIDRLRVIGRTSVGEMDNPGLGDLVEHLNVGAVLRGTTREDAGETVISVRLIDTGSGEALWENEYRESVGDLVDLQVDLASRVAGALELELDRSDLNRLGGGREVDRQAHLLLLRARHHWDERTREGIVRAESLLLAAIDIDPVYAEAWAALGDVRITKASYGLVPPRQGYPEARAAVERALEIDPGLPEAQTTLADLLFDYFWEFEAAEEHFLRAIERDPSHVVARYWYSEFLSVMGRSEEAARQARRAQEIDPLNLLAVADEGRAYYMARNYARAIDIFESVIDRGVSFTALLYRALALAFGSDPEASLAAFETFGETFSGAWERGLAVIPNALLGRTDEVERIVDRLETAAEQSSFPAIILATAYGWTGETDRAFAWLERSLENREWQVTFLATEPALDPLRGDPRFREILDRVGLPPAARDSGRARAVEHDLPPNR